MPCKHLLRPACGCPQEVTPEVVDPASANAPSVLKSRTPWGKRAELRAQEQQRLQDEQEELLRQVEDAVARGGAEQLLAQFQAALAVYSFSTFCQLAWHVVDKTTRLEWGRAHDLICTTMQAVFEDWLVTKTDPDHVPSVRNVAINCPPGMLKPVDENGLVRERDRGLIPLANVVKGNFVLTHKGRYREVLAVAEQGLLDVLAVKTTRGRVVRAAPDHPILTQRGWVEAGKITPRDVLASVHAPTDNVGSSQDQLAEARLIGYLIGDGCLRENSASFTNNDSDTVKDFVECAKTLGFDTASTARPSKYTEGKPNRSTSVIALKSVRPTKCIGCGEQDAEIGAWCTQCRNRRSNHRDTTPYERPDQAVGRWLQRHELGNKDSHSKRVPAFVMHGSDDIVIDYLAAYWACDGGIQDRRDIKRTDRKDQKVNAVRVDATTVSEGLANDHLALLQRLGLEFTLRRKVVTLTKAMCGKSGERIGQKYDTWRLLASDQDTVAKFMQIIGRRIRHEKASRAPGLHRTKFDQTLNADAVVEVVPDGRAKCRCLSVDEDSSFVYQGIAVHNSRILSVFFMAWCWLRCPGMRFICLSVNGTAAVRDALAARDVIRSEWYQNSFSPRWVLRGDHDAVTDYTNTEGGGRLSQASGSEVVGLRGDCVAEGTCVLTEVGDVPIEVIHERMQEGLPLPLVWSVDTTTGRRELQPVIASRKIEGREVVWVQTEEGSGLVCTPDHRVYSGGRFVQASGLTRRVVSGFYDQDQVTSVELLPGVVDVYDLQVQGNHNFFASGLLVHNCLIIDDANNPNDSGNKTERDQVNGLFDNNQFSRVNDLGKSLRMSVQQRTYTDDLTGHAIAKMGLWSPTNTSGWLQVVLSGERELSRPGFVLPECLLKYVKDLPGVETRDWRTVEGEPIHPRFTPTVLDDYRRQFAGTGNYAGQILQRPANEAGNKFKRHYFGWFRLAGGVKDLHDELGTRAQRPDGCRPTDFEVVQAARHRPGYWDFDRIVLSVDAAVKKTEEGSLWGMLMVGYRGARRYVMDDRSQRGHPDDINVVLRDMIRYWRPDEVLVEDKGGGSGILRTLEVEVGRGELPMVQITGFNPGTDDKVMRANAALPTVANGFVYLLDGAPWVNEFVEELAGFPTYTTNDRVDALTQVINSSKEGEGFVLPSSSNGGGWAAAGLI